MKPFGGLAAAAIIVALCGCAETPDDAAQTINSRADYADLMIACLAESGIEAKVQGTGLIVERTIGQGDVVGEAVKECEHELGYDTITRLSDDQLGDLYELEVETRDCLASIGFDVTLPSRQSFIDHYYSDKFQLLETQVFEQAESEDQYSAAMRECPPATGHFDPYLGTK